MQQMVGKRSVEFEKPPCILSAASVVGQKEGEGPLKNYFDIIFEDPTLGKDSWEEGESELVHQACMKAIEKSGLKKEEIRYVFAGDLLGQLIASTFGLKDMDIPLFGLYGACSTCGEGLALGAMTVAAGYAEQVLTVASSHFGSAEKQFRFPLEYGNQRPLSATWTVTGSGAFILSKNKKTGKDADKLNKESDKSYDVMIEGITTGTVVDYGIKDSMNMGAAMAPAACEVIVNHMKDFGRNPSYYDCIVTGDLGEVGHTILVDLCRQKGVDISNEHEDCGIKIFDAVNQNTGSGGSGCGCSATVLASYYIPKLRRGELKKILFIPTGALLSPVSFNEGDTVPGIAHGVVLEACDNNK